MFRFNGTFRRRRLFGITIRQAYQYYSTNINDILFRKLLVCNHSSIYSVVNFKVCFELIGCFHLVSSHLLEHVCLPEHEHGYPTARSTYRISFLADTWFILLFFYWLDIPIEDLSYFGESALFFIKFNSRLTAFIEGASRYIKFELQFPRSYLFCA